MKKYVLLAIVEDNPGVLTRVCQLFTRRSFNLDSVTAGKTEKEGFSRLTLITTAEDDYVVDQICKQMSKLEEVKKVKALKEDMIICKEIAMIKIKCDNKKKTLHFLQISFLISVRDKGIKLIYICILLAWILWTLEAILRVSMLKTASGDRTGLIPESTAATMPGKMHWTQFAVHSTE